MVRGSGRMPIGRVAVALAAEAEAAGHTSVQLQADPGSGSDSKMALSKEELIDLCELAGIEVPSKATKRELVALLDAAS